MNKELKRIQKSLMTGISYMVPVIVAGGVLLAFSFIGGTNEIWLCDHKPIHADLEFVGKCRFCDDGTRIGRICCVFDCWSSRFDIWLYSWLYCQQSHWEYPS